MVKYTKEQFAEFFKLVSMSGSANQMDRIDSRLAMPGFIERVGRETCNEMWADIESGVTPQSLEEK